MANDRTRLSDEGKDHRRLDPDRSEIEVDAANDSMGGPTTESLDSGLSPSLEEEDDAQGDAQDPPQPIRPV